MTWNLRPIIGRALTLLGLAGLAGPLLAADPTYRNIERVEPPFWWQGFVETELQLMVFGGGVADLKPSIDYDGVSIQRVERVDSRNYLFIYLDIDTSAAPGRFDIRFDAGEREITHEYELRGRNPDPAHARGFDSSDSIYLITPDRFANGDPDNDEVTGYEDELDRDNVGARHGGDIQGIADHLDYVADMGFTMLWLNPVLENAMPRGSYHGYATTDFYTVDPRFGSNESYRQLVAAARDLGIGVIMDMIANHCGSGHWWMNDLPSKDWINFAGEPVITNHQRTIWQDVHVSRYDSRQFADGWFVPAMPDLNQRNPLLADYLIQNALWWIEYLGLAGIRMDTYPYPDKQFMADWTRRIMSEYPAFNIVGEEWSVNPAIVSYWQRGKANHDGYVSYLPSLMDFPLRATLRDVLVADEPQWGSSWDPLYVMLANDFLYPDPGALVVFPDNHDMSRIFTQLGEDYDLFRMAIVYVLTMRGTPQIYYGTEILMSNRGSDDHGLIRSDFPGGWAADRVNAFTGNGLTSRQKDAQGFLRKLLHWRKQNTAVHDGALMHFSPIESVYAYFRYDDRDTVMVVFNKSSEAVTLETDRFRERIGDARRARDVISDKFYGVDRSIVLEPRSVLLLELQ